MDNLHDSPADAVSAAISDLAVLVLGDDIKVRLGHVEIALGTAGAAVPDGGVAGGAISAGDGNRGAAEGVSTLR